MLFINSLMYVTWLYFYNIISNKKCNRVEHKSRKDWEMDGLRFDLTE